MTNWQLPGTQFKKLSIYALLRGLGSSYSAFCVGISSNLSNLFLDDVVAQINSHDELTKLSNPIKDNTTTDFPPNANQTQITSSDHGSWNGGRYTPQCQLCGQYGHRVLECRERFNQTFHGDHNAPMVQSPQSFPQAYNLNLNTSPVPHDHSF